MTSACHSDLAKQEFVHLVASQGQMCVICHQAVDQGKHRFRFTAEGGTLCTQCHSTVVDKPFKHVPAAFGLCTFCHNPHQADNPKQLNYPPGSLCTMCHVQIVPTAARAVHRPAGSGQCTECHDPHSSELARQLNASVPELCFGCHDQAQQGDNGVTLPAVQPLFEDQALHRHSPFARGECLTCHEPHASKHYRLQKRAYPESIYTSFAVDKYFCFGCHDERAFTEPRTVTATNFRNGNLNLHYRHVNRAKGRSCRACHHHHAARRPALVVDQVPFGERLIDIAEFAPTEAGATCGPTCHRTMRYDRYVPDSNALKVTPREGRDATIEELRRGSTPPAPRAVPNTESIATEEQSP